VVDRLTAMRRPGERYSDVILRLAGSGEPRAVKTQSRAKTDLISCEI
jgi:hypothetical protein